VSDVFLQSELRDFTRPEIEGGPRRRFAMPFGLDFAVSERQNAERALKNACVCICMCARKYANLLYDFFIIYM